MDKVQLADRPQAKSLCPSSDQRVISGAYLMRRTMMTLTWILKNPRGSAVTMGVQAPMGQTTSQTHL